MGEERLTNLKPEIIRVLAREKVVCETALARLRDRYRPLEQQYGWTTDEFLKKFSAGEIGDDREAIPLVCPNAGREGLASNSQ